MNAQATKTNRISFQGESGANSDMACQNMFPSMEPLPCPTFEDAFNALETGKAELAMIPIENTIAGRVADIHHLLPTSKLQIIGEYFLPIRFQLMVIPGTKMEAIKSVHSHVHALGQCRKIIRKHRWKAVVEGDTAGAARVVAEIGDKSMAALAPRLAASLTASKSSRKMWKTQKTTSPVSSFSPATSAGQRAMRPKM